MTKNIQQETTVASQIMVAVGEMLTAKAGDASSSLHKASAGAKADAIILSLKSEGGHECICSTLKAAFVAMDESGVFEPTKAEMALAHAKDSSVTADDLRKKVNKARKQTAFRLFRNAFARCDKEQYGEQKHELQSRKYNFAVAPYKPKERLTGIEKWLDDSLDFGFTKADIEEIKNIHTRRQEAIEKEMKEQEKKNSSIRAEILAMEEQGLRAQATRALSLVGITEPTEEQVESTMKNIASVQA